MKADSFSRPTARVRDGKLEVRGGFTKREELLKDLVCALTATLGPAEARNIQPKEAKALVDSAETLASAFMNHLSSMEGLQYESILHRIENLEKTIPFPGEQQ